jgi:hypothetical protein
LEEVARLGAQLLMQAALEAEVTEFLGRDRYQRAAACADARPGARNGYREVTVKTTAGPVALARPKLRGTSEAFASRLFGSHVTKTNALESLVIASFVRGLSVRDVEAALAEALGDQAAISKSTVSSVCGQIKEEYEAWARRRLDGITLDYLFLDASFFRMHPGSPAEPVLAAWGITTDGKPAFIGLAPGTGESADAWHSFLTDLTDRGLACPLLVISDGAPGLIAAIEQAYPRALRQRCLIHRSRKDSMWRFGFCCWQGCEQVGRGAVVAVGWGWEVAVLFQQGQDVVNGVADGSAAGSEQVGQGLLVAEPSLGEHGGQDPVGVGDFLPEHSAACSWQPVAAAPPVAALFDRGRVAHGDPVRHGLEVCAAHSGQAGVGQGVAGVHRGQGFAVVQPVPQLLRVPEQQGGLGEGDPLLVQQLAGRCDGLPDRVGIDLEQFGQDLLRADLPQVEHGDQDAVGVG